MRPHKNLQSELEKRKKKFKPKVMVADLRKPNCEFTSDLVFLMHNTRLVKKQKAKCKTDESESL